LIWQVFPLGHKILRLPISNAKPPYRKFAANGADPTPADHAIQPRSPVGGHGIGGSRTLEQTTAFNLQPITPSIRGRPSAAAALAGNTWVAHHGAQPVEGLRHLIHQVVRPSRFLQLEHLALQLLDLLPGNKSWPA
jgi:hypothetical protein